MALTNSYPQGLEVMYPAETDDYLHGLPKVDAFNFAEDYANRPARGLEQALDQVSEAIRSIEVERRIVIGAASWLSELAASHPEAIERLSDERQAQVKDLIGRLVV